MLTPAQTQPTNIALSFHEQNIIDLWYLWFQELCFSLETFLNLFEILIMVDDAMWHK